MLSDEISKSGKIPPGDDESPSGEEESPSGCDETPSVTEGRQKGQLRQIAREQRVKQELKVLVAIQGLR